MIIDFHTHTFPDSISKRVLEKLSCSGNAAYFTEGTLHSLAQSMRESGVDISVNLPVMTRADQVTEIHNNLFAESDKYEKSGVITFGGMHPLFEDYRNEIKRLREHGIKGIKIHPAFYNIDINDIRLKRIIDAATDEDMIVVTHSGADISFPDKNNASVEQLLDVIEDVRPNKFVLAHMGGWQDWNAVLNNLAGANVWLDTSFSLGQYYPRESMKGQCRYTSNLDEKELVHLVRAHGSDKVLFATDSPWAPQKQYVDFIKDSNLTEDEKSKILGQNAVSLLGIADR